METNVQELGDSRVRVAVSVEEGEVRSRLEQTAKRLGREMNLPGFRKGKVPPKMVLQRVGREAVMSEMLEQSLADWYERALLQAGVSPVGEPRLEMEALPGEGEALQFGIEVSVRPKAQLGDYEGIEVGRPEVEVPDEAVEAELERLREGFARLRAVEREAREGDVLVIDYEGTVGGESFEGSSARDHLLELGSGRLLAEFEEALTGASAGEERTVEVSLPEDHPIEALRGKDASFAVTVKEVREKELPDLDDDFAAEASEFETLAELRSHVEGQVREVIEGRADEAFREAAVDAVAERATLDIPAELVAARAEESFERFEHSLQHQGASPTRWLELQGKSREEVVEEARPAAERALRREATLEAVADAKGIEPSEEEMIEALRPAAEAEGAEPEKLLERLRATGRDALLRADLRMRGAIEAVAAVAKPIPLEQAEAREKLWTPEKETEEKGELWTPGD